MQQTDLIPTAQTTATTKAITGSIVSRHDAADIFAKLAEDGRAGCFPSDISCFAIGLALERVCINSGVEDPLAWIIQGYNMAAKMRANWLATV